MQFGRTVGQRRFDGVLTFVSNFLPRRVLLICGSPTGGRWLLPAELKRQRGAGAYMVRKGVTSSARAGAVDGAGVPHDDARSIAWGSIGGKGNG